MRILDKQRYWAFLKAYVICFVSFVGLYVVIDAFTNFDEFLNITRETSRLFTIIGRFYAVRSTAIYDRLCGVISMMAAVFTVMWMQRDNELIAMLAAGISSQRVIRPVIISAILVNVVAIANQELVIPKFAEELQKPHGDDGESDVIMLASRRDVNDIVVLGLKAERKNKVIQRFSATLAGPRQFQLEAEKARYVAEDDPTSPLKGGWVLRNVRLSDLAGEIDPRILIALDEATLAKLPLTNPGGAEPAGAAYFFRTNVSFDTIIRRREWYVYGSTWDLFAAMDDPVNGPERSEIATFLHTRLIRPFLSMSLLCVTLPLVLAGVARNTFGNLGKSILTSASYYIGIFLSQYLASHGVMPITLGAWAPLIVFATFAVARWDSIRT
jgi:lipopolysaccharide export system permease protein